MNKNHDQTSAEGARHAARAALLWFLFAAAIAVYVGVLLHKLDIFPIYFFTDEAFHAVEGERIIRAGFRDTDGTFFPIYLTAAAGRRTPVFSIYLQGAAALLFGKSVVVTRAVSVLCTAFGLAVLCLGLKRTGKVRLWWLLPLVVLPMHAWFLHVRTGFEVAIMVGFAAACLGFYLLYRYGASWWAVPCTLLWFAAFYSYSNAQLCMPVFALLLGLSDFYFHLRRWRIWLLCVLLAVPCAVPIRQLIFARDNGAAEHLSRIGGLPSDADWWVWLRQYCSNYATAFSRQFWFEDRGDLQRHRILGQPHLQEYYLPLIATGLVLSVVRLRESWIRAVAALAVAAPATAALVGIGLTRVLVLVLPCAVWSLLAIDVLYALLRRIRAGAVVVVAALISCGWAINRVTDQAFHQAPAAPNDFGLYGMQWGAQKIFSEVVPRLLASAQDTTSIFVTSEWANAPERFVPFFIPEAYRSRVAIGDPSADARSGTPNSAIYILTVAGYERLQRSKIYSSPEVLDRIPYPDGRTGFVVVRTHLLENADIIAANDRFYRSVPLSAAVLSKGEQLQVRVSALGDGVPQNIFDGNTKSWVRGLEANPLFLEVTFPSPRPVRGVSLVVGLAQARIKMVAVDSNYTTVASTETELVGSSTEARSITFSEPTPSEVRSVWFLIKDLQLSEIANIHIWEVEIL